MKHMTYNSRNYHETITFQSHDILEIEVFIQKKKGIRLKGHPLISGFILTPGF